jgi:pimeloyl-ACP methyl ester carboxylesterase
MKYEFPNFKYLQQSRSPITVFHGTQDAVVPLSSAEKLKNLNIKNLDFITIDGGGHNNLIDYGAFNRKLKNKLQ